MENYDIVLVTLGNELKQLRQNKSWSQQDLADRLQISRSAITNYEIGKREIGWRLFLKWCEVCDGDANKIFEIVDKVKYKK